MSGRRSALIAERLGEANAARLSVAVGGTRLSVPSRIDTGGKLERLLGRDLTVLIVLHFGGSLLYVPVTTRSSKVDPRRVKRLVAKGWSSARIARQLQCSERTVEAKRALLRRRAGSTTTGGDRGIET